MGEAVSKLNLVKSAVIAEGIIFWKFFQHRISPLISSVALPRRVARMNHHYVVAEQFFDQADALRSAFESHFSNPQTHGAAQQVWNYWYVPGLYTYLKTDPTKIVPRQLIERFMQVLNQWASGPRRGRPSNALSPRCL